MGKIPGAALEALPKSLEPHCIQMNSSVTEGIFCFFYTQEKPFSHITIWTFWRINTALPPEQDSTPWSWCANIPVPRPSVGGELRGGCRDDSASGVSFHFLVSLQD